ncbi:MAG: PilZ domain-containing protein, partial [Propionivibrio sp.]
KLRYYPEFQQEIVFDTLIVAYCVNGNYVYSGDAIERDADGYPIAFRSAENTVRTTVAGLKTFQILVPDTSHLEMKLDYHRRALIGRGKQFNKGNMITLMSNAGARGVSTVDTEVAKRVVLTEGPYTTLTMVLLTPELPTLAVTDQRKKSRTKLCVPATVSLPEGQFTGACTIVDISEAEIRMRMRDREAVMPEMAPGEVLFAEVELNGQRLFIKTAVIRRSAETCVVRLEGAVKDGKLAAFGPLDLLELKAGLLNYGE